MRYIRFLTVLFIALTPMHARATSDFMDFERKKDTKVVVSNIAFEGTERVDPTTIISYLDIKPGDEYSQSALSSSLKKLYDTGLFADVSIVQRGKTLVVKVVENPVINRVAFEGNEEIEDSELLGEIGSRSRAVYIRNLVRSDVERIQNLYRRSGRYSVEVSPQVIRLDQNRIDLVFEITEGGLSLIQGIKFIGNTAYDDDTLRTEISSKEDRWYRFLSSDDRYDPDRLAYDQELLRRFYMKNGYIDFRVLSANAELSADKESFYITIAIDEGERYKIASVNVDTNQLRNIANSSLDDAVTMRVDDWYSSADLDETIGKLTNKLGDMQYAFAKIRPDVKRNISDKTVDITFVAEETPKVFVEKVDIKGNIRTLDKVIRREVEMMEGDPFSGTKLVATERNLQNLDFFNKVIVKPVPGSAPDQTDIEIDVEEKSTGEISIGAGFSTADGPLADFSIRERNFLGKGQDVKFATTLAGERTEFDVSFTEPYFFDRDLAAGFDVFHRTQDLQDESSYDQKTSGFALRTEYPFSNKLSQLLKYRIQSNEIENVKTGASRYVSDQEGKRITSAISQTLSFNDLDSNFNPTEGYRAWLTTELAGLGGDAKYVSGRTGVSYFYPVGKKVTLNLVGETGAIQGYGDEDVQINERYFIGSKTLRGFEYAGLGPRDLATNDALGGNLFYRGSAEVGFPVGLPDDMGIRGFLFSDFGSLWSLDDKGATIADDKSVRASVGFGLSWASPMGPLRLDFATPVVKEDYDEKETFRFDFGTRF